MTFLPLGDSMLPVSAGNPFSRIRRSFSFRPAGWYLRCFCGTSSRRISRRIPPRSDAAAMALAYNVRTRNEVDPVMKLAQAAGATVLKPAREASWGGYSGYFADPDGFAWEVAWNPDWKLSPDGGIHIPIK